MEKKRLVYLEMLRIIAVWCVIFNHTGMRGFNYYTTISQSLRYWLYMALSILVNSCVSVFYMVSGATLLGKNEEPLIIWKKRIPRIALALVVFSLLQALFQAVYEQKPFHMLSFLKTIYSGNIIVPYWYLYAYLAFLMMLPFFRPMAQNMTEKEFIYLFILYNVFNGLIPVIQYRLSGGSLTLNPSLDLAIITSRLLFYPVMGYWLSRRQDPSWKTLGFLWLASVAAVAATCCITHYRITLNGDLAESSVGKFYKAFHAFPVVTLFLTMKKLEPKLKLPEKVKSFLISFGGCTFGIYLIEQPLRKMTMAFRDGMAASMPNMVATLLYVTLLVFLGYGIVWGMKRIPGLRKLL